MRFNSLIFFVFLAIVVAVLWAVPRRYRRVWLLVVSYAFYASWYPPYIILLFSVAAVNHFGAKWIVAGPDRYRRGRVVLAGNLLVLALFKYLDWLVGTAGTVCHWFGWQVDWPLPHWVLPLGVSFYVFEAISYTMDIIRKRERIHGFLDFQLFIAFFPKLIAGPILRAKELLPQIENPAATLRPRDVLDGIWLLGTGLFIKVVLADNVALHIDDAFARNASAVGATDVWIMAVGFGLQIYFDFSSYSRMAIGAARLLGIQLVENFAYPYSAHSPVEFWNRWHMSLSRWIRDYLFFPLLGKQTNLTAMCRAALIAMTLCGLWHGAGWTFIVWGFYHGCLIAGYHIATHRSRKAAGPSAAGNEVIRTWSQSLFTTVAVLFTFALISLGWIWFRAGTVEQAWKLTTTALTPWWHGSRYLSGSSYFFIAFLLAGVWLAPFGARFAAWLARPAGRTSWLGNQYVQVTAQGLVVGAAVVLSMIYLRGQSAFIYFQF